MGERLLCKQEVDGSIPFTSTRSVGARSADGREAAVRRISRGPCGPRAERRVVRVGRGSGACAAGARWGSRL